ncbi:MAG: tetratricopeptide repeat protein [bacterium]
MRQINITIYLYVLLQVFSFACSDSTDRKIRLAPGKPGDAADVPAVSSVLQVDPEQRHTIAILHFENRTSDETLAWLSRGLADMLAADLSQSLYINIVPIHLLREKLAQVGGQETEMTTLSSAIRAAKLARVATLVTGAFYHKDGKLNIEVSLRDVHSNQTLRTESVEGESLERVFLMVDELSERVRDNLRGDLQASAVAAVDLSDMTTSVEAFKCYSEALDNMDKGLHSEAERCLLDAVALDTAFASAHLKLAMLHFKLGQPESSGRFLHKARQFKAKLSEPDRILLDLWEAEEQGDVEKLVKSMQDLLKFEPYDVDTRLQLANNLRKFCQYDRALEQYETILELAPERTVVYNQLAKLYADRGDFRAALWNLEKYEKIEPDDPGLFYTRGSVLMRAGRLAEAAEQLNRALERRPEFYNAARKLSEVYGELDDLQNALRYSDQWIEQEPNGYLESRAYTDRARLLWRFRKPAKAVHAINKAIETWPTSAYAVLVGGELLESQGKLTAAKRVYDNFLAVFEQKKSRDLDNYQMGNLLMFCTETDLDTRAKIRILEKFASSEKRSLQRQFYDMHLGILHLRAGNDQEANRYFASNNQGYLDLLTNFPHVGWSSAWKYTVEAIRLQPKSEQYDFALFDGMRTSARETGRTDLEVISSYFMAQYHGKYGRRDKLQAIYRAWGTPLEDRWRIIGPFENRAGFNRVFPPEKQLVPESTYQSQGHQLSWHAVQDGAYDGYVDLRSALETRSWAVAYAAVVVNSPEKRKVQIRLASNESSKLWLNNELVWQVYRTEEVPLDHDIVSVLLQPGDNKILLKVTNGFGDWGFYLRVTDEKGKGFEDISFEAIDREMAVVRL